MTAASLYRNIIEGKAGVWAFPVRALLRVVEVFYRRAVVARNRRFDGGADVVSLSVPVISVGNITVGGTGKTPFVIALVERLSEMGLRPAVIARGYKAAPGQPNDEQRLIQSRCPGVTCVCDPDRLRGARLAIEDFGANVIVLDDGFQHRRIARDLNIVLIDASCPFGFDHVLPRGLLREPVEGLHRADVVVLTRCDQVDQKDLSRVESRVRELCDQATILKCCHRVTYVDRLDGARIDGARGEKLAGKRAVLFAGIARPAAFRATVASLGVEVVASRWWPDHHRYQECDIQHVLDKNRWPEHEFVMTTEKDATKLANLSSADAERVLVVKVAIDFLDDGGTMLGKILGETLGGADAP